LILLTNQINYNVNLINISSRYSVAMENRTARLTVLIDPRKKKLFEEICVQRDLTPSQVVRRLIRQYIIDNAGGRELPGWLTAAAPRGEDCCPEDILPKSELVADALVAFDQLVGGLRHAFRKGGGLRRYALDRRQVGIGVDVGGGRDVETRRHGATFHHRIVANDR